ncbi:MAG: hypothetical protein H6R17_1845 [Proteobacteria bacterium]|nr:hypothetical protein [Pseudomonadota bacterium]
MAGEDTPKLARKTRRKFEFAVVVLIVGALALLLMRSLDATREEIEEASVQSEVAALRVELLDALAHREAFGGALPPGNNPLRWAGREPAAYLGELDAAPLVRGVWYFDRAHGELVYRFRSAREARFRLVRGADAAGVPGTLGGVGLLRVDTAPVSVNSRKGGE